MYVSEDIMLWLFLWRGAAGEKHPRPTIQHSICMKYTAERVGGEADLCRVRLVCRVLWMTWISPPARLHHIVLVPKKLIKHKVNQLSEFRRTEQRRSFVLQGFSCTDSILFCFIIYCQFAKNVLIATLTLRSRVYSRYMYVRLHTASPWMCTL